MGEGVILLPPPEKKNEQTEKPTQIMVNFELNRKLVILS